MAGSKRGLNRTPTSGPVADGSEKRPPRRREPPAEATLRAAARGDAAACEQVHAEVLPLIRSLLRTLGRRDRVAEELATDIAAEVIVSLPDFRGESSFVTWVYTITYRCLRQTESRERRQRLVRRLLAQFGLADTGSADELLESVARRDAMAAAVETLKLRQRSVILLSDVEELTAPEIAEVMGTTAKAVRRCLARARAKLRSVLRRRGYAPTPTARDNPPAAEDDQHPRR
jgi:RNA polymerase sigma-70 factor, ECF subfamily